MRALSLAAMGALGLAGLAACSREPAPRSGETATQSPAAAPAAQRAGSTEDVSSADLTQCDAPRGLLLKLPTLHVRSTRPIPFDSAGLTNGDFRPACYVLATGHWADSTLSEFDSLLSWMRQAGWREARYQADGPDGSSTGRYRDGVTCILSGLWDGGDDTDPTLVPSDTLSIEVTCAPTAAADTAGYSQ